MHPIRRARDCWDRVASWPIAVPDSFVTEKNVTCVGRWDADVDTMISVVAKTVTKASVGNKKKEEKRDQARAGDNIG